jgi:hypothetical protein
MMRADHHAVREHVIVVVAPRARRGGLLTSS